MIVADTNIIAYLYLESERSAQVEKLLEKDSQWVAPLLWRSEFRNVLALYLRKRNLSLEQAKQIMQEAMLLMREREYEIDSSRILELVVESGCSAYDCEFVALAQDLGISFVTVDQKIHKEYAQIAVPLDDILAS